MSCRRGLAMSITEWLDIFGPIVIAAVVGGAGCSLVGYYLSNLRLPFMGVCLSHAAMAGAVFASLLEVSIWPVAFACSVAVAFLVGYVAEHMEVELNVSMGILFSFIMGLAFLGIGLAEGPKTEVLGLIWGSVLLVSRRHVIWTAAATVLACIFAVLFGKELKAVLFSRAVAASSGIREGLVYYMLLLVSGLVITVNLESVGGLMLFSLLVAPPAAACRVSRGYRTSLVLSVFFGAVASLGGLGISWVLDTPTGASIVVVSSAIFALSALGARLWRP